MTMTVKLAEVVGNGRNQLFAQVAEEGVYTCWALTPHDIQRFGLRQYDEIVISMLPEDQFCRVIRHCREEDDQ